MATWYFMQNGRPAGPLTLAELKGRISRGEIQASDLLYVENDTIWRKAETYGELSQLFTKNSQPTPLVKEVNEDKDNKGDELEWVLLVRKAEGSGFKQKGPFQKSQILEMLKKGEVALADFAWRKGLKEWQKILTLPEFHVQREVEVESLPPLPVESSEKSASATLEKPLEKTTEKPSEKTNIDFSDRTFVTEIISAKNRRQTEIEQEIRRKVEEDARRLMNPNTNSQIRVVEPEVKKTIKRPHPSRSKKVSAQAQRVSFLQQLSQMGRAKKVAFAIGALFSLVIVVYIVTFFSTYLDRKKSGFAIPQNEVLTAAKSIASADNKDRGLVPSQKSSVRDGSGAVSPPEESSNQVKNDTKNEAKPESNPKAPPTYIKIEKINENRAEAEIKIVTDASDHYPLFLSFAADGGQTLSPKSFYKTARFRKLDRRAFKLSEFGLPFGSISISAEIPTSEYKAAVAVLYGSAEPTYNDKIKANRKKMFMYFNDERRALIKTLDRTEKEAYKFAQAAESVKNLKSWSKFYKNWLVTFNRANHPNVKNISQKNRKDFVLASRWLKLRELRTGVLKEAGLVSGRISKNQPPDPSKIKLLAQELTKQKDEAVLASLSK